jgi:hypothetical protein
MDNEKGNYKNWGSFLESRGGTGDKVFDEKDITSFRPSYEYIISKETKSCINCRSLVYLQPSDVKNLSLLEIVNNYYNPPKKESISTFDTILQTMDKIDDFFGASPNIFNETKIEWIRNSCKSLQSKLKVTERFLALPILHRCNKCFKAWNIHQEVKLRFQPPVFSLWGFQYENRFDFYNLPESDNFFQGIIFKDAPTENHKKDSPVYNIKNLFVDNMEDLITLAKKENEVGNLNGALSHLSDFVNYGDNTYFKNHVFQLKSRNSILNQEKIKGTISYEDEVLQKNRLSNDMISLIEEIAKYKNI